jgi:hypothetical protein
MSKLHRGSYFRTGLAILFLGLVALALGPAFAAGKLPATDWNLQNLELIKPCVAEPLGFAVFGDSRDDGEVLQTILREVDQDPSLAFGIHLGDMVRTGDPNQYADFFQEVRQDLHKPLLGVIGNHELYGDGGLMLFRRIFGLDRYSFQVQGHYFIMVNDADYQGIGPEEFSWLEKELKKSRDAKTRLLFMHVPFFDPRGAPYHHSLAPEAGDRLVELCKKYRVTHVFASHIHSYYAGAWEGLPFTITGGAGAPLYGHDPRHAFYHYLKVLLKGGQVEIQVRPVKGPACPGGDSGS